MLIGIVGSQLIAADDAATQPQPTQPRERGMRGGMGMRNPDDFRAQMMGRLKENLKATDDEWKVLEPKIEKLSTLQRETRMDGMRAMFGSRRGQENEQQPTTELGKKTAELQKLLSDEKSGTEDIKAALKAVRDAREKTKVEITTAQNDLRGVVNVRQEAQLVMMGLLD
ncbi:MAG: hypothetical protein AB1546_09690 [bacterium]